MANISILSRKTFKISSGMRTTMRSSFVSLRRIERRALLDERKLIKTRSEVFRALLQSSKTSNQKNKNLSSILGGALGLRGLRRITQGPSTGAVKKPRFQGGAGRLAKGSLLRNFKAGRLRFARSTLGRGIGRVGPLAVVGTAFDFGGRLSSGQNVAQASIGSGAGLVGALAGGAKGAAIGSAILPFGGTIIGGLIGATLGSGLASGAADFITGANRRRKFEERRFELATSKTKFSVALDQLDIVLDKLGKSRLTGAVEGRERRDRPATLFAGGVGSVGRFLNSRPVRIVGLSLLALGATVLAIKFAPFIAGKVLLSSTAAKLFAKVPLLKKIAAPILKKLSSSRIAQSLARSKETRRITNLLKKLGLKKKPFKITRSKSVVRKRPKVTFSDRVAPEVKMARDIINKGGGTDFGQGKTLQGSPQEIRAELSLIKRLAERGLGGLKSKQIDVNKVRMKRFSNKSQSKRNPIVEKLTKDLKGSPDFVDKFGNKVDSKQLDIFKDIPNKFFGGDVEKGMAYIVGDMEGMRTGFEELFIPEESGTIIPSEVLQRAKDNIIVLTSKGDTVSVPVPDESRSPVTPRPISSLAKVAKYAQFTSLLTV